MRKPNSFGLSCSALLTYLVTWAATQWLQSIPRTTPRTTRSAIPTTTPSVVVRRVSLKRSPPTVSMTYQSAIALKLANQSHQSVQTVAHHLHTLLTNLSIISPLAQSFRLWMVEHGATASITDLTIALLQYTTIKPLANGHLQIQLPPSALALWLQWLLAPALTSRAYPCPNIPTQQLPTPRSSLPSIPSIHRSPSKLPFSLLSTHARCCTILRLAHYHRDITLRSHRLHSDPRSFSQTFVSSRANVRSNKCTPSPLWTISTPAPLPWESMFASGVLPVDSAQQGTTVPPQSLAAMLCSYLEQVIDVIEALERTWSTVSAPAIEKSLKKQTPLSADVASSQKAIQHLTDLSQQFQRFEQQWTARAWDIRTGQPQLSSSYLNYLGLVCITQRVLNLPFIAIGIDNASLPHEL